MAAMTERSFAGHLLLFPFRVLWVLVTFLLSAIGVLLGLLIGGVGLMVGLILCGTIIGAVIGLPIIVVSLFILARALY